MNETWQFRKKFIQIFSLVVCIVSVLALSVMTIYAGNKVVIVTGEETDSEAYEEKASNGSRWIYDVSKGTEDGYNIVLPVSEEVKKENVDVSVKYNTNEIRLSFDASDDTYYHENAPYGSFKGIKEAYGEYDGQRVSITIRLAEASLCDVSYTNLIHSGEFAVKATPVTEIRKPVVLIDPSHGGNSVGTQVGELTEKEILLKIAKKIGERAKDKPYEILFTRTDDSYVKTEDKIEIIKKYNPGYYIGLELTSDVDNVKAFGMYAAYNAGYYRSGMQNVSFADTVLRNVCIKTVNKGLGVMEATDSEVILMTMDIPGTVLYAGYMSNAEELELLGSEEYIDKIAAGVINALDEVIK